MIFQEINQNYLECFASFLLFSPSVPCLIHRNIIRFWNPTEPEKLIGFYCFCLFSPREPCSFNTLWESFLVQLCYMIKHSFFPAEPVSTRFCHCFPAQIGFGSFKTTPFHNSIMFLSKRYVLVAKKQKPSHSFRWLTFIHSI